MPPWCWASRMNVEEGLPQGPFLRTQLQAPWSGSPFWFPPRLPEKRQVTTVLDPSSLSPTLGRPMGPSLPTPSTLTGPLMREVSSLHQPTSPPPCISLHHLHEAAASARAHAHPHTPRNGLRPTPCRSVLRDRALPSAHHVPLLATTREQECPVPFKVLLARLRTKLT